jgi:hypothetical protein
MDSKLDFYYSVHRALIPERMLEPLRSFTHKYDLVIISIYTIRLLVSSSVYIFKLENKN